MKIKAIRNQKIEYPCLDNFLKNSELLGKKVPVKWYKNKVLAGALSVFLLSGCKNESLTNSKKADFDYIIDFIKSKINNADEQTNISTKVAPIFVHGDGSGAIGCIVMAFPVFISESEARDIIFGELKKENILIDTADCPTIKFKADPIANSCFGSENVRATMANITLKLDGYDKSLNFVVEYVSEKDYDLFTSKDGCWSSVQRIDTKRTAEIIRNKLEKNGLYNAVVFYDPIESEDYSDNDFIVEPKEAKINPDEEKNVEKTKKNKKLSPKERSKIQLIAQVADFITWAKKEGLIK
jgi:hypothetical protein